MRLRGRKVEIGRERVFKFLPANPPRRGDVVLVDGIRSRVTSSRVEWREPGVWTLVSLRVKGAPKT